MAFSCCVRRSIRSLGPPIEHGRAIFHRRLLSTHAIAVIESAIDKAVPSPKDPEVSLVPNGFPFSVTSSLCDITLIREDQVERMEASILASQCWVEDGNPSVEMLVRCYRGYMVTHIEAILKPDSIRICKARIREHRNGHLEAFEEFLGSKGIDGEKLLGSFGGMFSKTWKPKKGRPIRGPVISRDESPKRRGNHLEQREKLGLNPAPKPRSSTRTPPPESADAFQRVEFEKGKQDDALSDLSNLLGELKDMAVDMGTEIDRPTKALDHFEDDVDELNNLRGRRLLGK